MAILEWLLALFPRPDRRGVLTVWQSRRVCTNTLHTYIVLAKPSSGDTCREKLTKQSNHARPAARLQKADKEAQRINLVGVLHRRQCSRQNPPSDLHPRQPQTRPDMGHDNLGRDQHDDVPDVEEGREAWSQVSHHTSSQINQTDRFSSFPNRPRSSFMPLM